MTRSDLIQILADRNPHLYIKDIKVIVNCFFDSITEALNRGDRVELRGFGTFSVKQRAPRSARNPKTGEAVQVGDKFHPFFKTGKELKIQLNLSPDADADADPAS